MFYQLDLLLWTIITDLWDNPDESIQKKKKRLYFCFVWNYYFFQYSIFIIFFKTLSLHDSCAET